MAMTLPPLPHIRFWQGFAAPGLTNAEITTALQKVLIPMTTEVGAGRGLIGYQPVVLKKHPTVAALPDEMALVIYRNQPLYEAIRATPEGARYGALHFKLDGVQDIPGMENLEGRDFIKRDNGRGGKSGSHVAVPVDDRPAISLDNRGFTQDDVVFGRAYAPRWGAEALWQGGAVLARVHLRQPGFGNAALQDSNYKDSLAYYLKLSSGLDLSAHLVRVERDYVLEYLFGSDAVSLRDSLEALDAYLQDDRTLNNFQTTWLEPLDQAQSRARDFALTREGEGSGYSLSFATGPLTLPKDNARAALALAPWLRGLFLKIASPATAYDANVYLERMGISRLTGHCAAVAYVVQKLLGGDFVRGEVAVKINGVQRQEVHYWNRIDGVEIDLTGSQYGGDGLHALDDPARTTRIVSDGETSVEFIGFNKREIRQSVTYAERFGILEQFMNRMLRA